MVNRTFGNRYQITEKIGMGGMAEVFKATDSTLGRTVAIKVMLPQYAADASFAARFRQEAQSAANLNSPYIVNIYDWGKDNGSYYIVMEYVRGTDLKTAITQRGHIHPRKVAEIGSQECSALSVAQGYDILHLGIKSANIMVQADGNVKVMDFGIAQAGRPGMTTDSSVLGTAHYVSPEQAQGKKLGPTSDLYSLGVVMYEAATGQLPFDGPDVVSVAMKQVSEAPVPPRQLNPDIDPMLEAIILKSLEKNPEMRYATANEMRDALDDYLQGRGSAAATQLIGGAATKPVDYAATHTTVMDPTLVQDKNNNGKSREKKKGKKGRIIAAILIVLVLAGAGVAVALNQGALEQKVVVPNVVGMTQQEAAAELQKYELTIGKVTESPSDTVDTGKVMSQDPQANDALEKDGKVNIVVSSGSSNLPATVPNLTGLTASEAEEALAAANLKGNSQMGHSDKYAEGKIFEQSPQPFEQVDQGATVTYTISAGEQGSETVKISNYVGTDAGDAQAELEGQGLNVKTQPGKSDKVGEGEVVAQSIAGGTEVKVGSTITLTVCTGTTATNVPDVTGSTESAAKATLKNAGFKVRSEYAEGEEGKVIDQDPSGGSSQKAGATIVITVGTGTSDSGGDSGDGSSDSESAEG